MDKYNLNNYLEIEVKSVEEIYEFIEIYNKYWNVPRIGGNTETRAFYRGQSNAHWAIEPSIVRCNVNEREQYIKYKEQLKGKDLFSRFAYLQHYATGTRLIDFTTNPDVALYFACAENLSVDAAFFLYLYNAHRAEWLDTIIFTEIMEMNCNGKLKIRDFSEMLYQKYVEIRCKYRDIVDLSMTLMGHLDHGYMVLPSDTCKQNNLRVCRQDGVFYICGVKFADIITAEKRFESRAGNNEFICHSIQIPDSLKNEHPLVKVVIPKKLKKSILIFLEEKGITKEYLFP